MSSAESLKLDAQECNRLAQLATRENVRRLLNSEAERLQRLAAAEEKNSPETAVPPVVKHTNAISVKIVNYGWDQSDKFVKLYVTLNGVQNLPPGNVISSFHTKSVELQVSELGNKNYSLVIKNLLHNIRPEESYHKVKTDMVVLFLKKGSSSNWGYITESEMKAKERKAPKFDKDDDPSVGLINMMKQMYEEGDDEMKRTIAKAWTEAREKPHSSDSL